jgi:hypothetical protein
MQCTPKPVQETIRTGQETYGGVVEMTDSSEFKREEAQPLTELSGSTTRQDCDCPVAKQSTVRAADALRGSRARR